MPGYMSPDKMWGSAKSETTPGVDAFAGAAPAAWGSFRALNIEPQYATVRGPRMTATNAAEQGSRVRTHSTATCEVPLFPKTAEDEGPNPILTSLLLASLFKRTVNAGVDVRFTDVTANNSTISPSATLAMYLRTLTSEEVKKVLARGCVFKVTLTLELGAEPYFSFEGEGCFDAIPDGFAAIPALPTAYSGDTMPMSVEGLGVIVNEGESDETAYPCKRVVLASQLTFVPINTGDTEGDGTRTRTLLAHQGEGPAYTLEIDLEDAGPALAHMLPAARAGDILSFNSVVTNGTDEFELQVEALQFNRPSLGSLPTITIPADVIRKPGSTGEATIAMIWR